VAIDETKLYFEVLIEVQVGLSSIQWNYRMQTPLIGAGPYVRRGSPLLIPDPSGTNKYYHTPTPQIIMALTLDPFRFNQSYKPYTKWPGWLCSSWSNIIIVFGTLVIPHFHDLYSMANLMSSPYHQYLHPAVVGTKKMAEACEKETHLKSREERSNQSLGEGLMGPTQRAFGIGRGAYGINAG
jgi:hypothetical protein